MREQVRIIGLLCVIAVSGCTQPGETTGLSAATGGVIGAGLGAIVGSQTGDAGTGVVIGAVAGSSAGALIGNAIEAQENTLKSQDEAIERQERTIAAQRAEIDQLRRLDSDVAMGARDGSARGRFAAPPAAGLKERTAVPYAVTSRSTTGLRESNLTGRTETAYPSSQPAKAAVKPAPKKAAAVTAVKPAAEKSVAAKNVVPEVRAEAPIAPTDLDSIGEPSAEPAMAAESTVEPAADVTGALQGAAVSGAASGECGSAAEEVVKAGAASDSADKLFHLRRALRLCPDNAEYHNSLGEIYLSLGRKSDAEYEFREAVSLNPNLESAVQNLTTLGK